MRISDWSSDVCSSDLNIDAAANDDFLRPADEMVIAVVWAGDFECVAAFEIALVVKGVGRKVGAVPIAVENKRAIDPQFAGNARFGDLLPGFRVPKPRPHFSGAGRGPVEPLEPETRELFSDLFRVSASTSR